MGCPFRIGVSTLRATLTLLALTTAACSGGNPEAGATATAGADSPVVVQLSDTQTYVSIENKTGAPLVGGELQIVQTGVRPPYKANLPRIENGMKRDIVLTTFRAADGTPFNPRIARANSVKLTAKDGSGKTYEQEIPFE